MLIARAGSQFDKLIQALPGEKKKYLSMWNGYLDPEKEAYNETLAKSIGNDYVYLQTSGHCDMKSMRYILRLLQPKAIIPIHTDRPDAFVSNSATSGQLSGSLMDSLLSQYLHRKWIYAS